MRVLVVRHYKTLGNASNQILGWGDAPRVAEWAEDLEAVDDRLRGAGIKIDAVYSSFLERSRQTAMYFARKRRMLAVNDAQALNEINYGALFRKDKGWVKDHFPEHKKNPDFVYPEGESFRQMQARSVAYLLGLEQKHPDDTLLVVVHAGVIRGFVCGLLGLDYAANLKRKISHRYIGDFQIRDGICQSYDELGDPSGFVSKGGLDLPYKRPERARAQALGAAAMSG